MSGIPLGKREDAHLEFKAAEALKDPEKIAREVVAMLNAGGGEVWVGLREEDGVAVVVEEIPEPEVSRQSLRDFLVSTVEPSPSIGEIEIDPISTARGSILRLLVKPDLSRKPYALVRKTGRSFWIRIADRLRVMDREEIREAFLGSKPATNALRRAEEILKVELDDLQKEASQDRTGIFWLRILPVPPFSLDLGALKKSSLLLDPGETENRRTGKTFFQVYGPRGERPSLHAGRLMVGESDAAALSIYRHEGIKLRLPLEKLHAGHEPGAPKPLHWLWLLELPVSVFRLLSKMIKAEAYWDNRLAPNTLFLCSIALFGLEGWTLRPFSPRTYQVDEWIGYLHREPRSSSDQDFILANPLQFPVSEVRDCPDRCGFLLTSRVYEAFGFGPDQMPPEFDPKAGRLILPE
jgi:hypothetical protein